MISPVRLAGLAAGALLALMATPATAHDCSGPDDCQRLPPNVSAGTGIAAVAAGVAAGWAFFRRRHRVTPPPCAELREQVETGEATIKDLEAQIAAAEAAMRTGPAAPGGASGPPPDRTP